MDCDWQRVADAVRQRREDLGLTQDDARPPSKATWFKLENAVSTSYSRRVLRQVCRHLRWTPDAIARICRGEQPVELTATGPPPEWWDEKAVQPPLDPTSTEGLEARVAELERRFAEQEAEIIRLRRRPAG